METNLDLDTESTGRRHVNCSICIDNKKVVHSNYYCFNCYKLICTSCLGKHNELYENHNVVIGLGDDRDLKEKCEIHTEEIIKWYCPTHDKLLCSVCRSQDHRKCQDLQNIREFFDEFKDDPEVHAVPAQLTLALENINKVINVLDKHVASIQQSGNGFLEDLNDYAKKLLSLIEELREEGKMAIKSKQEEILSAAKQYRQEYVLAKKEIIQCLDKLTRSKKWNVNMFVLNKKGQTIAQNVDALYNQSDGLIKGLHFRFMTDRKILDSLNCFNSIVVDVTTKDISSQGAVGGEVAPSIGKKVPINIRIQEDETTCGIKGFCHLSDESLLVADGNNRRLKRVDPSSSKVTNTSEARNQQPTGVCCTGPNNLTKQIVAKLRNRTDPSQKNIDLPFLLILGCTKVYKYNAVDMTQTGTIDLKHDTCSIACHDDRLYASSGKTLYVHNLGDGSKLKDICKDTDGNDLFCNISGIALNGPGNLVYVADWWRGLVCVDNDGKLVFHLSEDKLGLSLAWGVASDHCGHVFVGGMGSHNVVMVTESGYVVRQILSREDGVVNPCGLSYDVRRDRLFVGGWNSDQLLMVEMIKCQKPQNIRKSASSRRKKLRNIPIRIPEQCCVVAGCCLFSDGRMVIADCTNRKMLRFDILSSYVSMYCDTKAHPTDVCCVGPKAFAVAFSSPEVTVYSIDSMTRTRTIHLGHRTDSIACHRRGLLYCAGRGNTLYVHELSSGRNLQEICLFPNSVIYGIAVNGPGDRLYVADNSEGLICVNTEGKRIFHFSPGYLNGARGVTTDLRGNVFVCGTRSNNVIKVTDEGLFVEELLSAKDGIDAPRCLSYDVNRNQLIVGGWNNDQLVVVDLMQS